MASGNTDSRTGKLKVLAGYDALLPLIGRATKQCDVTVDDHALRWKSDANSPGATVQGDRIQSVTRHDAAFVVHLKPGANGVGALTFGASSDSDAEEWVAAVKRIIATASVAQSQPGSTSRPVVAATGATLAPDPTPIRLKYAIEGKAIEKQTVEKGYALLVIACDPRNLIGICDYSEAEIESFKEFSDFTFHTTLIEVKVPTTAQSHAVIFAPSPLQAMKGMIYGFRNESAKQFGLATANTKMTHNLVTVYQLADSALSPEEFRTRLLAQLQTLAWWPYGQDFEIRTSVTTPYFDHFGGQSLKEGLPWTILNRQGQKQTLLVHASTCFESALHCWTYANLMLDSVPGAQQALPRNSDAPIVVVGAGVSGILFATRLKLLGYTNVDILENTDRYGGKTHTIIEDGPYPPGSIEKTVCELGTCYLSPAYLPMVDWLKQLKVLEGNHQIDFTQGSKSFRGMVTTGQLPSDFKAATVIDYGDYVVLKAEAMLGLTDSPSNRELAKDVIAVAVAVYTAFQIEYMGWTMPMPLEQPPDSLLSHTFMGYLSDNLLLSLVGMFQYGYEVQGYGSLESISAYYGLTWITPAITAAILWDAWRDEQSEQVPVVTAWTLGWGDVWKQMVEKQGLDITYLAHTTSITRS
jgi:hypothetical protein